MAVKALSKCFLAAAGLCWLLALSVHASTPELGKNKLRRLVKLPGISFNAEWNFDPGTGFTFGSDDQAAQLKELRQQLQDDPNDAEAQLRLGAIYADVGDSGNAFSARNQAVQIYRQRLEGQPDDAELLAKLGHALETTGRKDEAESVLRRAVRLDPKDSQCWLALGRFLDARSRRDISEHAAPATTEAGPPGSDTGAVNQADLMTLARKRLEEAGECFERAVTNAPADAEARLRRGMHRVLRNYLLNDLQEASGERKNDVEILSDEFPVESLADLQQASRLKPKDYRLMGNVALFEIYGVNARGGHKGLGADFDWSTLPDPAQRSISADLARLDDLAQESDPKSAAGALEVLAILQGPVLHETNRRVANLRRAVALDPSREEVWEMLAGTLARAERYQELLSVCEDHLKQNDNARSHILLAKAYERLKQWDSAEEQITEALKESPNDITANLSFAALLLKRSSDEEVLSQANSWLSRCDQLMGNLPPGQKPRHLVIDLTLTRGIYLALTDDVESARLWVKTVLDSDRENELAREILAAMAY